ncbi:putative transmembrane protein [Toxoplasma gondii VEG]|uniref:Transmembrane protein n=1 Tax=Toxoplasma gondii (strain ATCC 50861 / VEG) TaxID=432359 RepID=V4ZIG4_TOXGV|nr:putative transmembrane protein [Toxoplasma gondii VEG]
MQLAGRQERRSGRLSIGQGNVFSFFFAAFLTAAFHAVAHSGKGLRDRQFGIYCRRFLFSPACRHLDRLFKQPCAKLSLFCIQLLPLSPFRLLQNNAGAPRLRLSARRPLKSLAERVKISTASVDFGAAPCQRFSRMTSPCVKEVTNSTVRSRARLPSLSLFCSPLHRE